MSGLLHFTFPINLLKQSEFGFLQILYDHPAEFLEQQPIINIPKNSVGSAMVKLVILISGKRKSGKDYCSEKLKAALSPLRVSVYAVSHSLKAIYANDHGNFSNAKASTLESKCKGSDLTVLFVPTSPTDSLLLIHTISEFR